ncbi:GH92 family glycosyl hydrolase [Allokutzneria sp. A3M-2-11 16]|uniref:GH92 family glycosyl hydrolase n=1 Tax=Allokutzneria sp. A3M-2-11 16 TaxID=2962043 RepID=UPI0020B67913|nr:GH92 family glycosyl hydrolase [Allokutzneria sp. A3M-2-11 16]MCP3798174.1 GH92 family glycosyl hydrolase [Allokutzneria sp. A3M-2-11 16]
MKRSSPAGRRRWRVPAALTTALAVVLAPLTTTTATATAEPAHEDLARWVNPFVGTKPGGPDHGTGGGAGNTFPGADVPFGMVQWSPDTVKHQHGGYFYEDNRIKGFSLTHLSGAGCSTYQDVPFMPFVGEVTTSPAVDPDRYVSGFSHANEKATPGYYGVQLDSGAKVDLTVTQRSGAGRFTFPANRPATLLVNTSGSIMGADDAEISLGADEISGWATSGRFCGAKMNKYRVYFHAKFDRPFASIGTWKDGSVTPGRTLERGGSKPKIGTRIADGPAAQEQHRGEDTTVSGPGSGGFVTFADDGKPVNVKLGLSFVSVDGAKGNLAAENGNRSFEQISDAARAAWNERLNTIKVKGGTDAERTTFYSSLYHVFVQPNVFSDADGRYIGFDGRIHRVDPGRAIYTNLSGWDIYRSEMQLLAMLAPKETSDITRSMIAFAEQGGSWDRWTVANSYTGVMNGDPYHIMVASAYAFGAKDFDARKALLLMLRGATQPTQGYVERPGLEDYQRLGYIANGAKGVWGPPATTLEYTSADFAIADLARRLGDSTVYTQFMRRAQYWQNVFNPASGYIQNRNADGAFVEPFNPASPDGWVEGNSAQYTWMVPYNARGLFDAMGGNGEAVKRLDFFFKKLNAGPKEPHAFLGNEPIMHSLWFYNFAGAPHKTQEVTRRAVNDLFGPKENGLMGNDDLGQMSSWYVFAAMGMYPVIPGRAELVLNSPLFEEVVISRPTGQKLVIKAPGAGTKVPYVTGVKYNGAATDHTWLPESFVERGGTVEFALSATPQGTWGTAADSAPPSFRDGENGQRGFLDPARVVVAAGAKGETRIGAQDFSGKGAKVRFHTGSPPVGLSVSPASGELTVPASGKASQLATVTVAQGTAEGTYRIPVTFTAPDGTVLSNSAITVLVAQPGSLRASFNNVGTSLDSQQSVGNLDGFGYSFSRDALAAGGIEGGRPVTVDGVTHYWPGTAPGELDNVFANGQTVNIDSPAGATKLSFLGTATNGKAVGAVTVNYTDGTSTTGELGFTDWARGGSGADPLEYGNRIVLRMPYRNTTSGTSHHIGVHLYGTAPIALDPAKRVRSVTLPSALTGKGAVHVFSIAAG